MSLLDKCREHNFIIKYKTKIHKGEKDEFCRNVYEESECFYRLILYSKNATPQWRQEITVDHSIISYAGHSIEEIPSVVFGREIEYQMTNNGEKGVGVLFPLAATTHSRIRKTFGQPVQLLIKVKGG
jgi:hypothetical protein